MDFFNNGRILKQINHSVIVLIPKTDGARKVGDFRTISLCNVIYKAISKIIVARLSQIMVELVDKAQTGFVQGHTMAKNILLVQELLRHYGRKIATPMCLIKVDIKKAFDCVSWCFLENILKGLNFAPVFINWTTECVTTTSYYISINGSLEGFFKGERGLRHGDPISPFLFVLGMEYLSRMLNLLHLRPDYKFHSKCAKHEITQSLWMIFFYSQKVIKVSVSALMETLEEFGNISGLRSNISKSEIFLAGLSDNGKQELNAMTGLGLGQFLFRYLGVPIVGHSLQLVHFGGYIRRITTYTAMWNVKSLSYAGRIELIRGCFKEYMHSGWASSPFLRVFRNVSEGL